MKPGFFGQYGKVAITILCLFVLQVYALRVLRAALVEYAHASLVMKDQTVATARKAIARQQTRHVKVVMTALSDSFHCIIGVVLLPEHIH